MRTKIYWILTVLVAAALLFSVGSAAFAQTTTPEPETPPSGTTVNRTLTVNGSGKIYMTPDIAYITIGVHTEGDSAAEAMEANNQQSEAVVASLRTQGIAEADIQTNNFSIYPMPQYDDQGRPTGEIRYTVDNSVLVTLRDITTVGDVLDTTVQAGANSISGIQFDVEDKSEALATARTAAVADARAKAEALADAAGVELGEVQTISEYSAGGPQPMYDMAMGGARAEAASAVPVQPGQMLLTLDVNVTFTIQ